MYFSLKFKVQDSISILYIFKYGPLSITVPETTDTRHSENSNPSTYIYHISPSIILTL